MLYRIFPYSPKHHEGMNVYQIRHPYDSRTWKMHRKIVYLPCPEAVEVTLDALDWKRPPKVAVVELYEGYQVFDPVTGADLPGSWGWTQADAVFSAQNRLHRIGEKQYYKMVDIWTQTLDAKTEVEIARPRETHESNAAQPADA